VVADSDNDGLTVPEYDIVDELDAVMDVVAVTVGVTVAL